MLWHSIYGTVGSISDRNINNISFVQRFTRSNFFHEFSLRHKLDLFESVYSENELEKCILKNTKNFLC